MNTNSQNKALNHPVLLRDIDSESSCEMKRLLKHFSERNLPTGAGAKVLIAYNLRKLFLKLLTSFSVSIHLLIAITEDPVRSWRARIASTTSLIVAIVIILSVRLCQRLFQCLNANITLLQKFIFIS